MSEQYCWGIFREEAHSPGRETDDSEILRLTGKHLEAHGFRVLIQSPEEIAWPAVERPRGVFFMCERLEILEPPARAGSQRGPAGQRARRRPQHLS